MKMNTVSISKRETNINYMKYIYFILLMGFIFQNTQAQEGIKMTDRVIIKKKIIQCSQDSMWWKWTTHEGLLTFFGEDNRIELKPGGSFEIYFSKDAPIGERGSEGCTILSFIPKRMISFSWNAPPSIKEARESGHHTCVVIEFKALGKEKTEITLTHAAWPEGEHWDKTYEYFDAAWNVVIQWLAESCK